MAEGSCKDLPKDYLITGVEVLESKMLGEGAYGVVKLGKYFGLLCAVKKLKPSMFPAGLKKLDQQTELILQSFYNECEKLSQIRHPNVVQLLGVFADKRTKLPVIVMEVMHESLSRLLYRTKSLPFHVEINICHDVSQALAYLHSAFKPPIVHRDLSSNNILLSEDQRAKITDLGVAKVAKGSLLRWDDTPAPGTLVYMPPEVRKVPADLTSAMDIFALGVNMVQIRTHKFPKPGPEFSSGLMGFTKMVSEKDRRKDHLELMGRYNPLRQIAVDCLKDNPRDRPHGLQLCERLERVKDTHEYRESLKLAAIKDAEVEGTRSQMTQLQKELATLREELTNKVTEVERLDQKLEEERSYTAKILDECTRYKLNYEILQDRIKQEEPEQKKKRKFNLRLKRSRSVKEKSKSASPVLTQQDENMPVMSSLKTPDKLQDEAARPIPNGIPESKEKSDECKEQPSPLKSSSSYLEIETPDPPLDQNKLTWYTHHCLPEGLHGSTLSAHDLGGRLYLCSGKMEDDVPNKGLFYSRVEDVSRWKRATPDLPHYLSASAIVQNELVIIGGLSAINGKCTGAVQSYDSRAQVWVERFPPMPTPRSSAAVLVYSEYVIVAGGLDNSSTPLSVVEVLHIPSQTWETSARLPIRIAGHSMVLCQEQVYVVGGTNGTVYQRSVYVASVHKLISSCSRFALLSNLASSTLSRSTVWSSLMECPFTKMTAVCKRDRLLAFGGEQVTKSASALAAEVVWMYNTETNSWKPVHGMPSARKLCCVTVLPDDSVVVLGGSPDYNRVDIAQTM